jgi:hypothetical protein
MALLFALPIHQAMAGEAVGDEDAARQFVQRQDRDPGPNVGKTIPVDITVLNQNGEGGNLQDMLRGPALVIKTVDGCPPCAALTGYVATHGASYQTEHGVQIVVLLMGSETAHSAAPEDRSDILWLHTPDFIVDGVLGGTALPAVYFFDQNLALSGVHAGLYDGSDAAMMATLSFPLSDAPLQ